MCHVIGNIFSSSVTNVIDTINILACLLTVFFILVSQSELVVK